MNSTVFFDNDNKWEGFIKRNYIEKLDTIEKLSTIQRCFLYKGSIWFYHCDRCVATKRFYKASRQLIPVQNFDTMTSWENFDTMTSWESFAKAFLGYNHRDSFKKMDQEIKPFQDDWEKRIIERIAELYGYDEDAPEIEKAYKQFECFSDAVYSFGNFIPIGCNPQPLHLNDRWDIKLKWIKDCFFYDDGKRKENPNEWTHKKWPLSQKRRNPWKEYWDALRITQWDDFIQNYCLGSFCKDGQVISFVDTKATDCVTPQDLNEWMEFFCNVSSRIDSRYNELKSRICENHSG